MFRIKRQDGRGTGHKEYPQIIQKPTLSRESGEFVGMRRGVVEVSSPCDDLVGRSRVSRRDFARSLHQLCLLPTNTKGDLRAEPALTLLQDPSLYGGPPPLTLKLGRSACWFCCFLNRACEDAYRLSSITGTRLCSKVSPF